jgi:hypothetical protein
LIVDAKPSAQDITNARNIVNTAIARIETDNILLSEIETSLNATSATAQTQLDNAQSHSNLALVTSAENTTGDAKSDAQTKWNLRSSSSIRTSTDYLIGNAKPSAEDITDARNIVSVAIATNNNRLLSEIEMTLNGASSTAMTQLNNGKSHSNLVLVTSAENTIGNTKSNPQTKKNLTSPSSIQTSADNLIGNAKPRVQDITDTRTIMNAAIGTSESRLLSEIRTSLNVASATAQTQLNNGKSQSSLALITSAENTMADAKSAAQTKKNGISSSSIRSNVDNVINNAKTSGQDINDARNTVNTTIETTPSGPTNSGTIGARIGIIFGIILVLGLIIYAAVEGTKVPTIARQKVEAPVPITTNQEVDASANKTKKNKI